MGPPRVRPPVDLRQNPASGPPKQDPLQLLQSPAYVGLLIVGAIVGLPVAAIAYFFLKWVGDAQRYLFTTLPDDLGFHGPPMWWPVPVLAVGGLVVALTLSFLPGPGGHNPAEGFRTGGSFTTRDLPAVVIASFATLAFGAVLGPEAPLILIGSLVAVALLRLVRHDAPEQAALVVGAAGSFAAISTLLISPLAGAFLLLEAAGIGAGVTSVIMAPGMLAAGTGTLVFVGLSDLTGSGTFSLAIPSLPAVPLPDFPEFLWALVIGLAAAVIGTAIRRLAFQIQPAITRRRLLWTPALGLAIAGLAIGFAEATGHGYSEVLFDGETSLAPLVQHSASWSAGALALLVLCKGLAYSASLAGFRGGPTFPGMFIGAAGGLALSHLPGLPPIAGAGMGIGAMTVVMLGGLPLSSVLLTLLFLQADGLQLISVVIIAVMVSYVASARLDRWLRPAVNRTGAGTTGSGA